MTTIEGSISEYAAHRRASGHKGCSKQAVHKAILTERIPAALVARGRVLDFAQADAAWAANTRERIDDSGAASPPAGAPAPDASLVVYKNSRADLTATRAQREAIRLAQDQGRVCDVEAACRAVHDEGARLRDLVLAVGPRFMPDLVAIVRGEPSDQRATTAGLALLDQALRKALAGLDDLEVVVTGRQV